MTNRVRRRLHLKSFRQSYSCCNRLAMTQTIQMGEKASIMHAKAVENENIEI